MSKESLDAINNYPFENLFDEFKEKMSKEYDMYVDSIKYNFIVLYNKEWYEFLGEKFSK